MLSVSNSSDVAQIYLKDARMVLGENWILSGITRGAPYIRVEYRVTPMYRLEYKRSMMEIRSRVKLS